MISFGLQANPARIGRAWATFSAEVESEGFRSLLVPGHLGSGGPISAMAAAMAATKTLRVGSLVLPVDFYNDSFLAEEFASLNELSGGRLEAGLGAGWRRADYEGASVPMDRASARIDRLRRVVERLRSVQNRTSAPIRLHLTLGGGGRKMLTLAAEYADTVNLSAAMAGGKSDDVLGSEASLASFMQKSRTVRAVASESGRGPVELQCLAYNTHVSNSVGGHLNTLSGSYGLQVPELLASPLVLVGSVQQLTEKVLSLQETVGVNYWVIKAEARGEFLPVIAAVTAAQQESE